MNRKASSMNSSGRMIVRTHLLCMSIDKLNIVVYMFILGNLFQYTANNVGTVCTVGVSFTVKVGVFRDDDFDVPCGSSGRCRWESRSG